MDPVQEGEGSNNHQQPQQDEDRAETAAASLAAADAASAAYAAAEAVVVEAELAAAAEAAAVEEAAAFLQRQQQLEEFRGRRHSLRLPASNVAAAAGLHPHKDLPKWFLVDLVYQGSLGRELLRSDAAGLALTFTPQRDRLEELAQRVMGDAAATAAVQEVLDVQRGRRRIRNVQEASAVKEKAAVAASAAALSSAEAQWFTEQVRSAVDTGYGTMNESTALDAYQARIGWPIEGRNAEVRVWPFGLVHPPAADAGATTNATAAERIDGGGGDFDPTALRTVAPLQEASSTLSTKVMVQNQPQAQRIRRKRQQQQQHGVPRVPSESDDDDDGSSSIVDLTKGTDDEDKKAAAAAAAVAGNAPGATSEETAAAAAPSVPPFFYILGSVDGIRDELVAAAPGSSSSSSKKDSSSSSDLIGSSHGSSNSNNDTINGGTINAASVNRSAAPLDDDGNDDDDDESWTVRPVIVECKHRMGSIHQPPPLHDQIQTVVYCLMYNVTEADIVQVSRQQRHQQATVRKPNKRPKENIAIEQAATVAAAADDGTGVSTLEDVRVETNATQGSMKFGKDGDDDEEEKTQHQDLSTISGGSNSNSGNVNPANADSQDLSLSKHGGVPLVEHLNGIAKASAAGMVASTAPNPLLTIETTKTEEGDDESNVRTYNVDDGDDKRDVGAEVASSADDGESHATPVLENERRERLGGADTDEPMGAAGPKSKACSTTQNGQKDGSNDSGGSSTSIELAVYRVSLEDPAMPHRREWEHRILPRLRSLVEAVYSVRSDDSKRRRMLLAVMATSTWFSSSTNSNDDGGVDADEEAWNMLFHECPWLRDCDTKFGSNKHARRGAL
jgi:hypothetical protein